MIDTKQIVNLGLGIAFGILLAEFIKPLIIKNDETVIVDENEDENWESDEYDKS